MVKRYLRRHRLEKKDPTAAISEAVKPIQYWVDPGAPEDVRKALVEGASWWNQAFEAAGFRNAFQVAVLPDGADPMDIRYNMINWVHRSTRGWSIGRHRRRSAHRRDHQGHRHARLAARPPGLPDLRRPALALHHRQREARHPLPDRARAHPPARRARSGPHARPRPQLLRQHPGLDFGDGLSAPAGEAARRRHHRHLATPTRRASASGTRSPSTTATASCRTGDEPAALTRILDDAWAKDLRYMTNQDTETQPARGSVVERRESGRRAEPPDEGAPRGARTASASTPSATARPWPPSKSRWCRSSCITATRWNRPRPWWPGSDYIYAMRGDGRTP